MKGNSEKRQNGQEFTCTISGILRATMSGLISDLTRRESLQQALSPSAQTSDRSAEMEIARGSIPRVIVAAKCNWTCRDKPLRLPYTVALPPQKVQTESFRIEEISRNEFRLLLSTRELGDFDWILHDRFAVLWCVWSGMANQVCTNRRIIVIFALEGRENTPLIHLVQEFFDDSPYHCDISLYTSRFENKTRNMLLNHCTEHFGI